MKFFTACLATETNTFSPMPTSTKSFFVSRKGDYSTYPPYKDSTVALFRKWAEAKGWEVAESIIANAEPAGITLKKTYEAFRDEIVADLKAALPVDAVLLDLHGAMVADGYDDCEGDLIAAARQVVGPDVPIGVELDLHCHITEKMVSNASIIITYKEYPHTDTADRALELFNLIADTAQGKIKPTMGVFDCKMIGLFYPTQEPMKSFVDKMKSLEGKNGVLSVSLAHCFPWGDVKDLGAKTLVVTDNNTAQAADLAKALGLELYGLRHTVYPRYLGIDAGLDEALQVEGSPVVAADVSDNSGGGAPGDSTFVLRRLLERGIENVAVGCIWDPIAVSVAMDAGVGAHLDMRIGGKMGPMSGDPLDLHVEVIGIKEDAVQYFGSDEARMDMLLGNSAAVRVNGIDIVLISLRTQTFSPEVFTNVGIDPLKRRLLIVKSTQHFYGRFSPIASEVIYITGPGAVLPDFKNIPYQYANRDQYPMVENPLNI
ncbi:MAG: M81 family metallopeptidase [Chloroflexi bacterium]|nr:M81 family metallopeptidase [Chloroflexota bacterium]MCC6894689.1 M81 family metallopeptidase [Anaerolineae bacterium]